MSVVFHTLVGAAIAHAAATTLRRPDGGVGRPGLRLLIVVGLLALLSHGVLDGLKHGYPLTPLVDVGASLILATGWCMLVRRPLRLVFAVALAGSFAPDVIDHTLPILRDQAHLPVPLNPLGPMFPWHWGEGSGSLYAGAPHKCHDLAARRNGAVSLTNHVLVVGLACGGILMSLSTAPPASARQAEDA
jgi:hypothetical protein